MSGIISDVRAEATMEPIHERKVNPIRERGGYATDAFGWLLTVASLHRNDIVDKDEQGRTRELGGRKYVLCYFKSDNKDYGVVNVGARHGWVAFVTPYKDEDQDPFVEFKRVWVPMHLVDACIAHWDAQKGGT